MKLKILFAISPTQGNSLIENFIRGLEKQNLFVNCSLEAFFSSSNSTYDCIHIQWPESLLDWQLPSERDIERIKQRLLFWKSEGAKIIITRHNFTPHKIHPLNEKLYQVVYQNADGMIHFEAPSLQEFKLRYPSLKDIQHTIIPHPWYDNIANTLDQKEARIRLGINLKDEVFLVFGRTRRPEEQKLVIEAFKTLSQPNKKLLITNGILTNPKQISKKKAPLKYLRTVFRKWAENIDYRNQKISILTKLVKDEDIQLFFQAADVVIIQRIHNLNSGNVPLGFTFKKVVIGPNSGNIGAILSQTHNPVFDPGVASSLPDAMKEGLDLARRGHGQKNYQYAKEYWNLPRVSQMHLDFYKQILASTIHLLPGKDL